jgi:hypothetical protein
LIPLDNPAESVPASIQAFGHQIGVGWFHDGHGFYCNHTTVTVPEKGVWVTANRKKG